MGGSRGLYVGLLFVLTVACYGDDGPGAPQGVFHIAAADGFGTNVSCRGGGPTPDSARFQLHLINTRPDTVWIDRVGSTGVILASSNGATVGELALVFENLPYSPSPVVLSARTGDIKIVVNMSMLQMCSTFPVGATFRDAQVSLRLYTTAGLYVTNQIVVRVIAGA